MRKIFFIGLIIVFGFFYFYYRGNERSPKRDSPQLQKTVSTIPKIVETGILPSAQKLKVSPPASLSKTSETPGFNSETSPTVEEENKDTEKPRFLIISPMEIDKTLEKSKPAKELSFEDFGAPSCYKGEYYPVLGKPDQHEVELWMMAKPPPSTIWEIHPKAKLVVSLLGSPVIVGTADGFKAPPKSEDVNHGFFILAEEKYLYQIFKNENFLLDVTLFEKVKGAWEQRTTFQLRSDKGFICAMAGQPQ